MKKNSTLKKIILGAALALGLNNSIAQTGAALNFDGVNDICNGPLFSTNNTSITLEARVNLTSTLSTAQFIAGNGNTGSNGYGLFLPANTSSVYVIYGGQAILNTGYTLTPNQWTMLSMTFGGGILKLYVNGVQTYSLATANPFVPSTSFVIGGDVPGTGYFKGAIDEVRFWNRALCASEILHRFNCQAVGNEPDLIACYNFNQGIAAAANSAVAILNDIAGVNNTCTLFNFALTGAASNWVAPVSTLSTTCAFAPNTLSITPNAITLCTGQSATLTVAGATSYTWSTASTLNPIVVTPTVTTTYSVIGTNTGSPCYSMDSKVVTVATCSAAEALDFDGVNDLVSIANTTSLNPSKFTIETWLKWGASGITVNFVCGKAIEQMEIHTGGPSSNNIRFIPTTGVYLDGGVNTFTPGVWVHVACVYDPSAALAKMYVNGVNVPLTLSGPNSLTTAVVSSTSNFIIGNRSSGAFPFLGKLDEFRIWNTARTQCEINTYMNCEIPTTANGLVANYHFNQGIAPGANPTVTTLSDFAGASLTGTLSGFALTGLNSNWASPGGVVSGYTVPSTPAISAITSTSILCIGQSATLTASGATSYTWNPGGAGASIIVSPTVNSTYTVTGNTNSVGCTPTSTITQSVSLCTGVATLSGFEAAVINVYPNPGNGLFTIDLVTASNIIVIDVLGKIVYSVKLHDGKHILNLSNLNNGLYILKSETNGMIKTERLIKE